METEKKLIAFVIGLCVGHYGLRWVYHAAYAAAIVAAFFIGKHWGA